MSGFIFIYCTVNKYSLRPWPNLHPWPQGRLRGHILKSLALASKVKSMDLEASSPQKLPCPRLEDSSIFCTVEILLENARNLAENLRRSFCFPLLEIAQKFFFYNYLWTAVQTNLLPLG